MKFNTSKIIDDFKKSGWDILDKGPAILECNHKWGKLLEKKIIFSCSDVKIILYQICEKCGLAKIVYRD